MVGQIRTLPNSNLLRNILLLFELYRNLKIQMNCIQNINVEFSNKMSRTSMVYTFVGRLWNHTINDKNNLFEWHVVSILSLSLSDLMVLLPQKIFAIFSIPKKPHYRHKNCAIVMHTMVFPKSDLWYLLLLLLLLLLFPGRQREYIRPHLRPHCRGRPS